MIASRTKLSDRALSLLCCPQCEAPLLPRPRQLVCSSDTCGAQYPVVDDMPILLDETACLLSIADIAAHANSESSDPSPALRLKEWVIKHQPSLRCNRQAAGNYKLFAQHLLDQADNPLVLVIGGKEVGAGLESLLAYPQIELIETDILPGPRAALICDAHRLPLSPGSVDGVIIQAVLDDLVDPHRCVQEIFRILRPGGLVYSETPFMQPVHDGPFDFTRFTRWGHRRLFRHFDELASGAVGGPGQALAGVYHAFALSFARTRTTRAAASVFAHCTGFWLKYLDWWLLDREAASTAASGYYFLGRKSDQVLSDRDLIASYSVSRSGKRPKPQPEQLPPNPAGAPAECHGNG